MTTSSTSSFPSSATALVCSAAAETLSLASDLGSSDPAASWVCGSASAPWTVPPVWVSGPFSEASRIVCGSDVVVPPRESDQYH